MTRAAFLDWCHPDLLGERLLHASALWQVRVALDVPAGVISPPERWPLSELDWCGCSLALASARADGEGSGWCRFISCTLIARALGLQLSSGPMARG